MKLGDVADFIRNGVTISQSKDKNGLPITRIETIADRTINLDKCGYAGLKEDDCSEYALQKGDILISHINSEKHLGKCAYFDLDDKVIHGMNLLCFRNKKDISDSKYLFHFLSSSAFLKQIPRITKKSVNQASFSISQFRDLEIYLPDLSTQTQIAKILDKSTALIAKRKAQIAELDGLVQSVFLEMFGDPANNPKGWATQKISEVAPIKSASVSTLKEPVWLLNLDKVESNTGIVLEKEFHFLKDIGSSTQVFTNENVLYCKLRPYLNKVVLPDENGISTSELLPLKPNHLILTREFLACYLRSEYFVNWANTKATGAKMPRLSTTDLKDHLIILPTKSLQDKFSEIYQKIQTQKSQLQQSLAQLEIQHQALMQRAFKGELV